ncbi:ribosomal small subunit pseudouridine synthase A [Hathewaya proteolytica DSM 3090]|uniref:Pseudouridine synthase n=1 Tax=Hathewaya proteolytica DSM 3090 TaxID=1121331 RepID=A0A1M6RHM7_9CLOT|nr:pseudouridine synthase [Hathewaya proteolytica]SHK31975.1 ribosomal small subunit pseudouridine synthase A [Hathewaya proteolytica DSM 3090]
MAKYTEKEKRYYMFHKPMGCVTARIDKDHKTVFDYFNEEDAKGLFHVGRLDKDTEGLLFITNDGEFEHKLMYPENHVCKTYFFWAIGSLETEDIKKLECGVSIVNGTKTTKPARVEILHHDSYEALKDSIDDQCGRNLNYNNQYVTAGYLTISEGCKHQVKRMLKAVGCYVVYLKRISIGSVKLDERLRKGAYRPLSQDEVSRLIDGE